MGNLAPSISEFAVPDQISQVGFYGENVTAYSPAVLRLLNLATQESTSLHEIAESVRNPNQERLIDVANMLAQEIRNVVSVDAVIDLGGSLASRTAVAGHNDVDLKVLIPEGPHADDEIIEVSQQVGQLIPFEKDIVVTRGETTRVAAKHSKDIEIEGVEGAVQVDVVVDIAHGRVGYAKLQEHLPPKILDEYVIYKALFQQQKLTYKKVKQQFYAMTRWLHAQGYMSGELSEGQKAQLLDQAKTTYWGTDITEILSRPEPDV